VAESREVEHGWGRSWWTLVPFVPFGWLTGFAWVYAAIRARARWWWVAAVVYLVLSLGGFGLVVSDPDPHDTWRLDVGMIMSMVAMMFGGAQGLALRRDWLLEVYGSGDPALQAAERRLAIREEALGIVQRDPLRARELGIGRPDVPRSFDGGLVDVNHASIEAIAGLPRMDRELAERVVAIREEIEGFDSLEDMGAFLDLPAPQVERMRGLAVFLPR